MVCLHSPSPLLHLLQLVPYSLLCSPTSLLIAPGTAKHVPTSRPLPQVLWLLACSSPESHTGLASLPHEVSAQMSSPLRGLLYPPPPHSIPLPSFICLCPASHHPSLSVLYCVSLPLECELQRGRGTSGCGHHHLQCPQPRLAYRRHSTDVAPCLMK